MLRVEGLTIRSEDRLLVSDVSFALEEGRITCLIGPSGCGKSSVVKWLSGVLPDGLVAEGAAHLDDERLSLPTPAVAYQPQQDSLFPWLTIGENAALGLEVRGMSRSEARARVLPLLEAFGLGGQAARFPRELSGGMRQRAAFLRTIVQPGRFLLLDEPFSALDAVTRLGMQTWLCDRLRETPRGVLMVTHDLYEATQLADRVLVMAARPGRIVADIPITPPRAARTEANLAEIRTVLRSLLMEEMT